MARLKVTDNLRQHALALWQTGLSLKELSQALGCSFQQTRRVLQGVIPKRKPGRPPGSSSVLRAIDAGLDNDVVQLYKDGLPLPLIAKQCCIPLRAVRKILIARRIKVRTGPKLKQQAADIAELTTKTTVSSALEQAELSGYIRCLHHEGYTPVEIEVRVLRPLSEVESALKMISKLDSLCCVDKKVLPGKLNSSAEL
ncbi:MAG TPA: hypothetical protein VEK08_21705 [Planctomycetota bacterium]|nr:hypothetical protein [Planctomycetota bacterium]